MPPPAPDTTSDLRLTAGPAVVDVYAEAGGRIGQITVAGRTLLRGPEHAGEGWIAWGWYPLLPWSNRIPGGVFEFEGETFTLPVNHTDGTAIHGLAATAPWRVERVDTTSAELAIDLDVDRYRVTGRQRFGLAPDHLDQTLSVTNEASWRLPVGLGIHPWFATGPIEVPAERCWPGDTPLPTGPPIPVDATTDLRTQRVAPPMDRNYTGLTATTAAIGDLTLTWEGPIDQMVVYTGSPGWVCVEPVTMANDGFGLAAAGQEGTGVVALDPGQTLSVSYRLAWPTAG